MMKMKDENEYKPYGSDLDDIAFRVNYDKGKEPYITISGHEISKPHRFSDIDTFFEYVHGNANKTITSEDIKRDLKIELKKGMDDILRDLGFRGKLATIFFKQFTNKEIYFVNPVYERDLKKLGIDRFDIWTLTHTPKRKGATTMTR